MSYLLDTCIISYFFRKEENIVNNFKQHPPKSLIISSITVMEIEYGLELNLTLKEKIYPLWENLLKQIKILKYDIEDAKIAARIRTLLKLKGNSIGAYDLLLASTALRHNLIFVTANIKEFEHIVNLKVENWR